MISSQTNDSGADSDYQNRIGFLRGQWVPHSQMHLGVDDLGFRQGVTSVERLRTYQGRIFALEAHLRRWHWSNEKLGIKPLPSAMETTEKLQELLHRNQALLRHEREIGITMFATPGMPGGSSPTFGLHLNRLNHDRFKFHRRQGQPLILPDVRQPRSSPCPPCIKSRAPIHYFLADAFAARHRDHSLGVLIDEDGSITETSTSNLAIVKGDQIISPPADRVLAGVTQLMIEILAQDLSLPWSKDPISIEQLIDADEVLMMGTDGGIWFANSVSNRDIGGGNPGAVFLALRDAFDRLIGTG